MIVPAAYSLTSRDVIWLITPALSAYLLLIAIHYPPIQYVIVISAEAALGMTVMSLKIENTVTQAETVFNAWKMSTARYIRAPQDVLTGSVWNVPSIMIATVSQPSHFATTINVLDALEQNVRIYLVIIAIRMALVSNALVTIIALKTLQPLSAEIIDALLAKMIALET